MVSNHLLQIHQTNKKKNYCRTTQPTTPWIIPIFAGIPFGTGISQILQSLTTYLMDAYEVYFASAAAATVVLRCICGAIFPLFSGPMFETLGDEWAMSVFAGLSTICMPIPLVLWVRKIVFTTDLFLLITFLSFIRNTASGSAENHFMPTTRGQAHLDILCPATLANPSPRVPDLSPHPPLAIDPPLDLPSNSMIARTRYAMKMSSRQHLQTK